MTKKCKFLRPFELNGRSLSTVDQSQNLSGTTSRMWATFSLCLRFIASRTLPRVLFLVKIFICNNFNIVLDCNYTSPIDLAPIGSPFGAKST